MIGILFTKTWQIFGAYKHFPFREGSRFMAQNSLILGQSIWEVLITECTCALEEFFLCFCAQLQRSL